ncbi:rhodanese-like domain-containing protein [Candidatus Nomurabacteria bacterium]|mgnify:FL=1|nr:rhodanese-like domain-containing protein [Candidatus Nomurabacteria bacterium]
MIDANQLIIDVREPFEFLEGHVSGAINIPSGNFLDESVVNELKAKQNTSDIILYCRTGVRAGNCLKILEGHGFSRVSNGINKKNVELMQRLA